MTYKSSFVMAMKLAPSQKVPPIGSSCVATLSHLKSLESCGWHFQGLWFRRVKYREAESTELHQSFICRFCVHLYCSAPHTGSRILSALDLPDTRPRWPRLESEQFPLSPPQAVDCLRPTPPIVSFSNVLMCSQGVVTILSYPPNAIVARATLYCITVRLDSAVRVGASKRVQAGASAVQCAAAGEATGREIQ